MSVVVWIWYFKELMTIPSEGPSGEPSLLHCSGTHISFLWADSKSGNRSHPHVEPGLDLTKCLSRRFDNRDVDQLTWESVRTVINAWQNPLSPGSPTGVGVVRPTIPQSCSWRHQSIILSCSKNTLIVWFYMGKDDTQA